MNYILTFLFGGILLIIIKYFSENIKDIRFSAVIATFPLGLITSVMITQQKLNNYIYSYGVNLFILFLSNCLYYIIINYINRYIALILIIFFIFMLNYLYIIIF